MKTIAAVMIALVLAGCSNTGSNTRPEDDADRYETRCHQSGGLVSRDTGWDTTTYNCIGQTTGPKLEEFKR